MDSIEELPKERTISFEKHGNYLPWEQGYYEYDSIYKNSDTTIYCYKHYFNGKCEVIETHFPIDCNKVNFSIMKSCNNGSK